MVDVTIADGKYVMTSSGNGSEKKHFLYRLDEHKLNTDADEKWLDLYKFWFYCSNELYRVEQDINIVSDDTLSKSGIYLFMRPVKPLIGEKKRKEKITFITDGVYSLKELTDQEGKRVVFSRNDSEILQENDMSAAKEFYRLYVLCNTTQDKILSRNVDPNNFIPVHSSNDKLITIRKKPDVLSILQEPSPNQKKKRFR